MAGAGGRSSRMPLGRSEASKQASSRPGGLASRLRGSLKGFKAAGLTSLQPLNSVTFTRLRGFKAAG
jgi:hypothetical protein